jgi:uncharacterized protein YcaQ
MPDVTMKGPRLTAAAVRRAALAAQGFTDARPTGAPTRRHLQRVLQRTRVLQLDSVNVAVRAHYAPVYSRLGGYDLGMLDEAAWAGNARRPRLFVEYWAHMAALIPIEDWPLFRWRMRRIEGRGWHRMDEVLKRAPGMLDELLDAVKSLGPIGAGALERQLGARNGDRRKGWWGWSECKIICEWLFDTGQLTTATRRGFERLYDLPERVLPPHILDAQIPDQQAVRTLVERAAVSLGVATEPDLRDYFRLAPETAKPAVRELVEAGRLEPVTVDGWRHQAYRHVDVKIPRTVRARALLCPFDPLIWERDRTERLFDFHYRIEIYVPEPKRVYGYYVYPFLLDDQIVARVDLKADRRAGVLRVPGAFSEQNVDVGRVTVELAAELHAMAGWLRLDGGVAVGERGDLAAPLAALCR